MGKLSHGGDIYRHKNVIDFSSNCNPFGPPEGVVSAICQAAREIGHYPDTMCDELKSAIRSKHGFREEWMFIGNGAAEVIFTLSAATKPHKVLMPAPTFSEYEESLPDGCQVARYYMDSDLEIKEDILDFIDDELDMVFICNPNNPTGRVTAKPLLVRILEKCRDKNVRLVVDECFLDFASDKEGLSMEGKLEEYSNLVILKAFTKLYAMAGVRLGYCLTSDMDLIGAMENSVQPWNVSSIAQAAGIAALEEDEYVRESLEYIEKEKKWLAENLRELGISTLESEGNYLFFSAGADLGERLMEYGLMVRDCSNYEGLKKGDYRIAVRLHEDNEKLIKALKEILWQKQ